jgi:hypothetical protein
LSGIGESGAVVEVDLFGVQVDVTAVEHSVSLTLSLLLARHSTFTPRGTTWMIIYMSGCAAAMTSNPMPDRSVDHHIVVAAARAGSDGRDRVHDMRASKVGGALLGKLGRDAEICQSGRPASPQLGQRHDRRVQNAHGRPLVLPGASCCAQAVTPGLVENLDA